MLYYFTSKLEIKPQQGFLTGVEVVNYFTSKLEIKPQLYRQDYHFQQYYFTSKLEIKPQRGSPKSFAVLIILHQN